MSACAYHSVCLCACVCVFMPGIGIFLLHLQFLFSLNLARLKGRPICYASIACANCKTFQMKISIIMQRPRENFAATTTATSTTAAGECFKCLLVLQCRRKRHNAVATRLCRYNVVSLRCQSCV